MKARSVIHATLIATLLCSFSLTQVAQAGNNTKTVALRTKDGAGIIKLELDRQGRLEVSACVDGQDCVSVGTTSLNSLHTQVEAMKSGAEGNRTKRTFLSLFYGVGAVLAGVAIPQIALPAFGLFGIMGTVCTYDNGPDNYSAKERCSDALLKATARLEKAGWGHVETIEANSKLVEFARVLKKNGLHGEF